MTLPTTDWDFQDDSEEGFVDWFHGDFGPYTFRSEYFYGDCEIEDIKTLKDQMFKWVHVAFVSGFERGRMAGFEAGFNQEEPQ